MNLVFHHTDMDGYASAAVVNYFKNNCYFRPVNYKDFLPTLEEVEKVNKTHKVTAIYIVDYSFTKDTLYQLQDLLEDYKVYWIDHHKSSLEVIDIIKNNPNLYYYVNVDYCGAVNTWTFITNVDIPYCLKLVDSWDTWKHSEENDFAFKLFFDTKKARQAIDIFTELFDNDDNLIQYISEGQALEIYTLNIYKNICKKAYEADLNGLHCIVVNTTFKTSLVFNSLIASYDAGIVWYYDGHIYDYSIYTAKNIDVSKIAEIYGGGGHPCAAGFTSKERVI